MSDPAFSVVIAAFNEEDVITTTLESVQRQTRTDWEAWVIDDGSTDATVERVQPFLEDRRIELVSQPNAGLPGARNTGIARSRGHYVSFLDSDDLMLPDYLEKMGAALDADERAGFAYTDAWSFDTDKHRFRRATALARNKPPIPPPADPMETMIELIARNYLWVAATVRRDVLEAVGRFDEEMRHCEDLDLWLRILRTGRTAIRPPGVLGIKRVGSGQMSSDSPAVIEYLILICERVDADQSLPEPVRAAARARIEELRSFLAALAGSDRERAALLKARLAAGRLYRAVLAPYVWRSRPPKPVREAFPDFADRLGVRQATRLGSSEVGRGTDVESGAG
jgi:glycosyltransferase involved in cell wall biosynthesis